MNPASDAESVVDSKVVAKSVEGKDHVVDASMNSEANNSPAMMASENL